MKTPLAMFFLILFKAISAEETPGNCMLNKEGIKSEEWTWLVKLYEKNKTEIEMNCGGTIVTARIVVSVKSNSNAKPLEERRSNPIPAGVYYPNNTVLRIGDNAMASQWMHSYAVTPHKTERLPSNAPKCLPGMCNSYKWLPSNENASFCTQLFEIKSSKDLRRAKKFKNLIQTLSNYSSNSKHSIEAGYKKLQSFYATISMTQKWIQKLSIKNDGSNNMVVLYLKMLRKIREGKTKEKAWTMSLKISLNISPFSMITIVHYIFKLEIEHGVNVLGYLEMHISLPVVSYLINTGANINSTGGYKNRSIIHRAVEQGDLELVQYLVTYNADIYARDSQSGDTILHVAAREGYVELLKYLTSLEFDVNIRNNFNSTPFYSAASYSKIEAAEFLIIKGGNVNAKGGVNNGTALHAAAVYGDMDTVEFLLFHDINVNAKDKRGWTALHTAAWYGRIDTVKYLVNHGANIRLRDNEGWTVLHSAAWTSNINIVKYLLGLGCDVNARGNRGETPLHKAVATGDEDLVKFLVTQANADVDLKDNEGHTALDAARKSRYGSGVAEWLENFIIMKINKRINQ